MKNIQQHLIRFIGILLLFPAIAHAQPSCQMQHFSIYNGLPQRTVVNIVQDTKGFIWLATWNGLSKFDGYTFKNYKAYPGDGCTLTSNRLYGITPNDNCDIWCQTYDSRVYLFNTRREKFIDILQPFEQNTKITYTVRQVYALPKGVTWIVCDQGNFRVEEKIFQEGSNAGITFYAAQAGNLPGGNVSNILQDADADEWVFTDKGIEIVGKKTMPGNTVFKNACISGNHIYLLSENNRLATYHQPSGQLQFQKIPPEYTQLYSIESIGKDSVGVGTENGLLLFDGQRKLLKYVDLRTPGNTSFNARFVYRDRQDELWVYSTKAGVTRYNPKNGEKQYYQTPPQDMPKAERISRDVIFEDNQGTLWAVPHLGCLSYYDRESKQLKPYYTDYDNPESKFKPVVLHFFLDKQNNFWCTDSYEMTKITFLPNAAKTTTLTQGFDTRAFLTDREGNLWMANKKGIVRILHPDGSLKGYLSATGSISATPTEFGKNIYCFMEDKKGHIWMGSKWDGIFCLKREGDSKFSVKRMAHDPDNAYSLSNNSIYSIFQDSHSRIWVGTYGGGLNLVDEATDGQIRFLHNGNDLKTYPKNKYAKVRIISEVKGTLLVGTTEGLLTFAPNFQKVDKVKFHANVRRANVASSLCSNDVTHIYTDSRKQTYVLTFTGGINQVMSDALLTDSIVFKAYTKREGLPSDLLLSMIEDQKKKLWIISENALTRFDPQTGAFDNYETRRQQKEIYFSEAVPVMWNSHLVLGTESGILEVNPALFIKSNYAPPIAFTGLRIHGVPQELAIDDLEELRLKPSQRNVTFLFTALDYVDPTTIQYAYRLKGLEEQWNEVDNSRTANYINLPPGEYELQIRSTNSDGVWTDNVRTLSVKVLPTFWETGWAWVLYVLLFILFTGITVYILIYIYKLHHQINLEHQLSNIKLRFFTDISHELRTPLTLITSPVSEVLEHEPLSPTARKHLTLVHSNTERMLRLVNQILDFRKIENKKMKVLLENTDITGLLHRVMDNFRLMAEEKNIDFRLLTSQEELFGWIDQDKFEKIVFNLLSNAFKYTPANKTITINVRMEEGRLVVAVKDQGIGIDPQKRQKLFQRFETLVRYNILQPSSGIGLSLVKELIELHQGSIEVNSEPGQGSEFIVCLPINRQAYEGCHNTEFILNDVPQTVTSPPSSTLPHPDTAKTEEETKEERVSVLIVEDNNELRDFLHSILAEEYHVIEATDGQEGLECALLHVPDVIISDIMMPRMDGLDMVKTIKGNRDVCHIPIVLLSAKSSLDDRIAGLEQGIDDYITKPFSSTYLKARIKALLEQRRVLQELYLKRWSEQQKETSTLTMEPVQPQITPFDEQFMQQVMEVMERQMDNSELTIEAFAQELNMGRTVFYQKLKSILGLSPVDFIREMRVKRAKQLLDSGEFNVSSVAYMTGFNDPKYFSKCFKKMYGMSPSEHYKEKNKT